MGFPRISTGASGGPSSDETSFTAGIGFPSCEMSGYQPDSNKASGRAPASTHVPTLINALLRLHHDDSAARTSAYQGNYLAYNQHKLTVTKWR